MRGATVENKQASCREKRLKGKGKEIMNENNVKQLFSENIICPFYRKTRSTQSIVCEGYYDKQTFAVMFQNSGEIKFWLKNYCCTYGYMRCPHAKSICEQYDKAA